MKQYIITFTVRAQAGTVVRVCAEVQAWSILGAILEIQIRFKKGDGSEVIGAELLELL